MKTKILYNGMSHIIGISPSNLNKILKSKTITKKPRITGDKSEEGKPLQS